MYQKTFKKESGTEPKRSKIKPDHTLDMKGAFFIIPGTAVVPSKPGPGEKFCCKDQKHINDTPEKYTFLFQKTIQRADESGRAVNWKHP